MGTLRGVSGIKFRVFLLGNGFGVIVTPSRFVPLGPLAAPPDPLVEFWRLDSAMPAAAAPDRP